MVWCRVGAHDWVEHKSFPMLNKKRTTVRYCERCGIVVSRANMRSEWGRLPHLDKQPKA